MKKNVMITCVLVLVYLIGGLATTQARVPYGDKRMPEEALMALSEEKEIAFHTAMRQMKKDAVPKMKEMRENVSDMRELMAAEKFDEQAFRKQAEKTLKLKDELIDLKMEMMIDLVKDWSAEERQAVAYVLQSHRSKMLDKMKRHDKGHGTIFD
ncbi:MAG: periplasmic heavy metal sensor [Verrucomicrobiota bacterium]